MKSNLGLIDFDSGYPYPCRDLGVFFFCLVFLAHVNAAQHVSSFGAHFERHIQGCFRI